MKTIKRLVLLAILLMIAALYFAFTSGGDRFRWMSEKTENVGETLRDTLDKTADRADELRDAADKSVEGLKKLKEIKEEMGKEGEK